MDSQEGCESINLIPEDVCASDFPVVSSTTIVNPGGKSVVKSRSCKLLLLLCLFIKLTN